MNLWTTIVSNKLLAGTNIILFLNKTDIMRSKLVSHFEHSIASCLTAACRNPESNSLTTSTPTGNDQTTLRAPQTVRCLSFPAQLATHRSQDLRKKFGGLFKEHSPSPRVFYCHLTTVTVRTYPIHQLLSWGSSQLIFCSTGPKVDAFGPSQ